MPAKHTFKIKTQILLIVYIVMNRVPPWSPIIYSENRYIVGYDISCYFFQNFAVLTSLQFILLLQAFVSDVRTILNLPNKQNIPHFLHAIIETKKKSMLCIALDKRKSKIYGFF